MTSIIDIEFIIICKVSTFLNFGPKLLFIRFFIYLCNLKKDMYFVNCKTKLLMFH